MERNSETNKALLLQRIIGAGSAGSAFTELQQVLPRAVEEAGSRPARGFAKRGEGRIGGQGALRALADRWGTSRLDEEAGRRCIAGCIEFRTPSFFSGFYAPCTRRNHARRA